MSVFPPIVVGESCISLPEMLLSFDWAKASGALAARTMAAMTVVFMGMLRWFAPMSATRTCQPMFLVNPEIESSLSRNSFRLETMMRRIKRGSGTWGCDPLNAVLTPAVTHFMIATSRMNRENNNVPASTIIPKTTRAMRFWSGRRVLSFIGGH
jgi:hypothetical protein